MSQAGHRRPRGRARDDVPGMAASEAPDLPPLQPDPAVAQAAGAPVPLEPLDVDGLRPILAITVCWGVAALWLLLLGGDLEANGRDWWLWTCVAGFGLGLFGYAYCRRRRDVRRATDARVSRSA